MDVAIPTEYIDFYHQHHSRVHFLSRHTAMTPLDACKYLRRSFSTRGREVPVTSLEKFLREDELHTPRPRGKDDEEYICSLCKRLNLREDNIFRLLWRYCGQFTFSTEALTTRHKLRTRELSLVPGREPLVPLAAVNKRTRKPSCQQQGVDFKSLVCARDQGIKAVLDYLSTFAQSGPELIHLDTLIQGIKVHFKA